MTAGVVQGVIPSSVTVRRSPRVGRRPLPLPPVPPTRQPGPSLFGTGTIDCNGRLAETAVLAALGWDVGTRLNIRVQAGLVLLEADEHGVFRITRRGHVRLPAGVRDWCGLAAGDRVLLTADLGVGLLVVHPPTAVTAMAGRYHAAILGGEVE